MNEDNKLKTCNGQPRSAAVAFGALTLVEMRAPLASWAYDVAFAKR
jgi:hypothetical protein